ncbi:hypothetical protein OHA72_37830 [Dactylosporangium sp. NBC_01737]|uniref:hypothetical protein n=1 Tax=Dactylosporangium sp. NBC_01737 TaxID=2975959 RepID=UPI002E0F1136|nr:hypothetical protein OHA72_37830 [Dactylosporangium sp. NBC_01737]
MSPAGRNRSGDACVGADTGRDEQRRYERGGSGGLIGGPMRIPEIAQRIAFITDNIGTIIELTAAG